MAELPKDFLKITFESIVLPEHDTQPKISLELVSAALAAKPKRICFTSTHSGALKLDKEGKYLGKFAVPFRESLYPIFHGMTELDLFHNPTFGNWWRSLQKTSDVKTIQKWLAEVGGLVFLRDTLALSIALGEHQVAEGGRSTLGALENAAKYQQDPKAMKALLVECLRVIKLLPFYSNADAVCAIPPRPGKEFDLPSVLSAALAAKLGIPDLTPLLSWKGKKPSLKEVPYAEKWAKLEAVGLIVKKKIEAKRILLVDDLYQSGITMQFVAMHLLKAGASKIYGLALVKSRRDSDNQ